MTLQIFLQPFIKMPIKPRLNANGTHSKHAVLCDVIRFSSSMNQIPCRGVTEGVIQKQRRVGGVVDAACSTYL